MRYLEGKLAGVNLDNKDLRVENAKLKDELRAANGNSRGSPRFGSLRAGAGAAPALARLTTGATA